MEHIEKKARRYDRCFDHSEKTVLLNIVTKHYSVIESKETDALSVRIKNVEWIKIAEKFAAASSMYPRDSSSLKILWENIKRKAKLVMDAQADNQYGTGEGKAKKVLSDPFIDKVVGLIQRSHVESFQNFYEDDCEDNIICDMTTYFQQITGTNDFNEDIEEEVINQKPIDEQNIKTDWSQYNPIMLKSPMSATLCQPPLPTFHSPSTSYLSSSLVSDMKPIASAFKSSIQADLDNKVVSQRRPVLTTSAPKTLLKAKILSLNSASADAREEHKLKMQILLLQKQQEEEKLTQEKIKTELLKYRLEQETGIEVEVSNDEQET